MKAIERLILCLIADRRANTALEYGIIAGVLCLVLIALFQRLGNTLSIVFLG